MNDILVNSCPKSLSESPTDNTHTYLRFTSNDNFTIPMGLRGAISYFPTRKSTPREYNKCRHLELTAETPEWNPHALLFDENENAMTDEASVHYTECEPYSSFQNRAKAGIKRELKRAVKWSTVKKSTPMLLWDCCAELQSNIRSSTALDL